MSDWGPAELNGGRLAEGIYRYLEWKKSGSYTPIDSTINRTTINNSIKDDSGLPDSIRFQIRKILDALYDFRNKRDVAHLGSDIDVDEMDARYIMRASSWILSEIIRSETSLSAQDCQNLIDKITIKSIPLVEEIEGDIVILDPNLKAYDRTLIILYHYYPESFSIDNLFQQVGYSDKYMFNKSVISKLQVEKRIHIKAQNVYLTRSGISWVEKNINFKIEV